jgi:hypothetical protein
VAVLEAIKVRLTTGHSPKPDGSIVVAARFHGRRDAGTGAFVAFLLFEPEHEQ